MIARLTGTLAIAAAAVALVPAAASAATINVDILTDEFMSNGNCSLREAVHAANSNSNGFETGCEAGSGVDVDVVSLGNGQHDLDIDPDVSPDDNVDGDLDISDPAGLQIIGAGRSATQIEGANEDRILDVVFGAGALTVQALSVQLGTAVAASPNGGGIRSDGSPVTLAEARVGDNVATGFAGGIQMSLDAAVLTLNNSTVEANNSTNPGGGINLSNGASVVVNGPSQVRDNTSAAEGGGINVQTGDGDVTLNPGSVVELNNAAGSGGGINDTSGVAGTNVTVNGATVSQNMVTNANSDLGGGGGINFFGAGANQLQLTNAIVSNNSVVGQDAAGGGININSPGAGVDSITGSTITGNQVVVGDNMVDTFEGGGGVHVVEGAVTFTSSTIGPNTVQVNDMQDTVVGGGIFDEGTLTLDRSTVTANDISPGSPAGRIGAGVYDLGGGPLKIVNSTFSGNTMGGSGVGGGVAANLTPGVTIAHTTFALNNAGFGDAINLFSGPGTFTLRGSLIDEGANGCFDPMAAAFMNIDGFNVDAGNTCVGIANDTDLKNATPMLGPLTTANGGSTATHALLAGSGAINFVPTAGTGCDDLAAADLMVDQRGTGFVRPEPVGGACDAGSFEVQDTDNDGLVDTADNCPTQAGSAANGGCPPPPVAPLTPTASTVTLECTVLRAKLKKAKTKRKKRKIRKRLKQLSC